MKLVPNFNFDNHEEASAQRDNVKKSSETSAADNLLEHQIAIEAVNKDVVSEEADLTEEDLKNIAKETMKNSEENSDSEQDSEKFIVSEECELIVFMSVIK